MADQALVRFAAGKELLALLDAKVKPKAVRAEILAVAARLAEEARSSGVLKEQQNLTISAAGVAPAASNQQTVASASDTVLTGAQLQAPRGKFDIAFLPDALLFETKGGSFTVPYTAIDHVLILEQLPQEPADKTLLVLVLDRSFKVQHGKAQLDVVVVQSRTKPEVTLQVPASCHHLGAEVTGPAVVVLCQLLGALIATGPDAFLAADAEVYSSSRGAAGISANIRANPGTLFPLPGALCFIGRPSLFLRHADIASVDFARAGGASSTFDMQLTTLRPLLGAKAGGGGGEDGCLLELGQIDASELARLQGYLEEQGVRIGAPAGSSDEEAAAAPGGTGRAAGARAGSGSEGGGDDEEDEDEDYDPGAGSGGDDEPDAKRLKPGSGGAAEEDIGSKDSEDESDEEGESGEDEYETDDNDGSSVELVDEDDVELSQ